MTHAILADAADLVLWADRIDARSQLPRLIRRLVYATVPDAAQIAFPADEGVQLGGWDGIVRTAIGRGFVPTGVSTWEMGVTANVKSKADEDYDKRSHDGKTPTYPQVVRSETTFVFVTPRHWGGKAAWVAQRQAENLWHDVRAYDADDLIQWLEQSLAVHPWVSALLGKRPQGAQSLDDFWADWSGETDPSLPPALLLAGREQAQKSVLAWLRAVPAPNTVTGDFPEEAIAFLAAVVNSLDDEERTRIQSRTVVVDDPRAWRSLSNSFSPLILIPRFEQPEGIGRVVQSGHHVFLPSGPASEVGGLPLPRLNRSEVEQALQVSGISEARSRDLATLARRSLSALRRKLALAPAMQRPAWAQPENARALIGPLLAGAWTATFDGDQEALARLSGVPYEDVQANVVRWATEPDPPLRRVGDVWIVAGREDAWLLLARYVTNDDLKRFKEVVLDVLGERNPALDLPQEERFAASLRGKVIRRSGRLREGLAETLALMGATQPETTLATSVSAEDTARHVVWALLEQIKGDADIWTSLSYHLPLLAEAAPSIFLDAVDAGLSGDKPLFLSLFQDKESAFMLGSSSPHTGLLWALETLAWNTEYFARAVMSLARLAGLDPGGRQGNRPSSSLRDIFLSCHPNTAALLPRRMIVLDMIRKREPKVAWRLMIQLLPHDHSNISPTHRTKWRDWVPDPWTTVTLQEYIDSTDAVLQRLLSDAETSASRWADLIKACGEMTPEQRERLLRHMTELDPSLFSSDEKARVWNTLRETIGHHREFPDAPWAMPGADLDRLETIYSRFEPGDYLVRHRWLFERWVRVPGTRPEQWEGRSEIVEGMRITALKDVIQSDGLEGAVRLAETANEPSLVGAVLSRLELSLKEQQHLLDENLAAPERSRRFLARGFVTASAMHFGDKWIDERLSEATGGWTADQFGEFFLGLPFSMKVVDRVDLAQGEVQSYYWSNISHVAFPDSTKEADRLLTWLLTFRRSHMAMEAIEWALSRSPGLLSPQRIATALEAGIITPPSENFNGQTFAHHSAELLSYLENTDLPREHLARLEWGYLGVHQYYRRPRILHQEMSRDPVLFVELLNLSKNHSASGQLASDAETDEPETDVKEQAARATMARNLLDSWKKLPGKCEDGALDTEALRQWVQSARKLAAECDRIQVCNNRIGHLFAFSPIGTDGAWPHEAVRDLIEEIADPILENGWAVQINNNRGVTSRQLTDGGEQERVLASQYQTYADQSADFWPRTAATLKKVADGYQQQAVHQDEQADLTQDFWH